MTDEAATVRDGKVFWRGSYMRREDAERLADLWERTTDWFRPTATEYARQLREALAQTEQLEDAA